MLPLFHEESRLCLHGSFTVSDACDNVLEILGVLLFVFLSYTTPRERMNEKSSWPENCRSLPLPRGGNVQKNVQKH